MTDDIEVTIPEDATPEERERLIDAAATKRIEDDLDKILGDAF